MEPAHVLGRSRYGPRAALAAGLVGFAGVAGAYFAGGQLPFSATTPQPASLDGPQPGGERAEILRMVHQVADDIRALKARVEAVHAQSPSTKEATALEGLNARLDAVKTETGAEIAELAGKVDRLQREVTTKLAKASEQIDRPNHRVAAPRAAATKAPRGDASIRRKIPAPRERLGRLEVSPRPQGARWRVSEGGPANAAEPSAAHVARGYVTPRQSTMSTIWCVTGSTRNT